MGDNFAFQSPSPHTVSPQTDVGQAIFEQDCKSCHTIGGGQTVGPDIKGVTERRDWDWLVRFIVSPSELFEQGDPLAKQLVEEYNGFLMPNLGLSAEEAETVLVHIEAQSGGVQSSPPPEQDVKESVPALTGSADIGRSIFVGKTRLKNGGAACLSCHNISGIGALGGGTVGKDLTTAYSTFGEQGLVSLLQAVPFPMMEEVYAEQPLTDDEITNLVIFLQEVGSTEPTAAHSPTIFIIISVVGFLLVIGILQLIWRRRISGVRQTLVKGGSE
jgi:mono/diheme cytochrome c family protein